MKFYKTLLTVLVAVFISTTQALNISGKVVNVAGTGISGALIKLEASGLSATSGADGSFSISSVDINSPVNHLTQQKLSVTISNRSLHIKLIEKSIVEITTYTITGKLISRVHKSMDAGNHVLPQHHKSAGLYLYKIQAGNTRFFTKVLLCGNSACTITQSPSNALMNTMALSVDDFSPKTYKILATKDGYIDYHDKIFSDDTSGVMIIMFVLAGTVTDADGNIYEAIQIGNQIWTLVNLRTTKLNDGTPISLVTGSDAWKNLTTPGRCYINNITNEDIIKRYGALYNWSAVNSGKLAPQGWHVPTSQEWDILETYLIKNGYNWDGSTTDNLIAKSMAAKTDWVPYDAPGTVGMDLTKNNKSGFSALPASKRYGSGPFSWSGRDAYWWSATDGASRSFSYVSRGLLNGNGDKSGGLAVRLVKNQ